MYTSLSLPYVSILEQCLLQRITDMYRTSSGVPSYRYVFNECWDLFANEYMNRFPARFPQLAEYIAHEDFEKIMYCLADEDFFLSEMNQTLIKLLTIRDICFTILLPPTDKQIILNKWVKEVW